MYEDGGEEDVRVDGRGDDLQSAGERERVRPWREKQRQLTV